jgi:hypothetical protein
MFHFVAYDKMIHKLSPFSRVLEEPIVAQLVMIK